MSAGTLTRLAEAFLLRENARSNVKTKQSILVDLGERRVIVAEAREDRRAKIYHAAGNQVLEPSNPGPKPALVAKFNALDAECAALDAADHIARDNIREAQAATRPCEAALVDAFLAAKTPIMIDAVDTIRECLERIATAAAVLTGMDIVQAELIGTRFEMTAEQAADFFMGGPIVKPMIDKLHARVRPPSLTSDEFNRATAKFAAETLNTIYGDTK